MEHQKALYARQALRGIAAEIRQTPPNARRNECLNAGAYRMGRMVARGWTSLMSPTNCLRRR
jgi:hypothetical protein